MSDKMSEVYEQYDMEIYQTSRGRGTTILRTDKGIFQLKTPDVNESRLIAEYNFKERLYETGFIGIDRCVKNKEGELVSYDRYGNAYVMRTFFDGRECDIFSREEIMAAVENLAKLHIACTKVFQETESDVHIRQSSDFRRRNQELKRIHNFIYKRRPKKDFEEMYMRAYHYFYPQALECEKSFGHVNLEEMRLHLGYCHGMYNHHSIMMYEGEGGRVSIATINFDKFYVGNQLADVYHFMRKTVEKNDYSFDLARDILESYNKICPLYAEDILYIYTLYSYPEKFYKIGNQYINGSKNHISPKMNEKLEKVMEDEDKKLNLLQKLYMYISDRG
ncbi:MAG: hypothetical protein ACI4D8_00670 [Wujia sp.]